MANFDNELVRDVLDHADIVRIVSSYITLTKKGKNFVGICPFHDDTNPSLFVSPEKKIFNCFVCGTGGNAITFVQKFEKISYFDAVRKVAELSDYHDERLEKKIFEKPKDAHIEALYKCLEDLALYYQYALTTEEGNAGVAYFEKRNIDVSMREKYMLGYSFPNGETTCKFLQQRGHSLKTIEQIGNTSFINGRLVDRNQGRVIFTICDNNGHPVGFSARKIDESDEPKYVNSAETDIFKKANVLYNFHRAKQSARSDGFIYILEGFLDVFALSKIGIDSSVALMGTALSEDHIFLLRQLGVEVRLCLDGDAAGQSATLRTANSLARHQIPCRIVNANGNLKDPDEILNQDGPETLKQYLNNLVDRIDFALSYYQNRGANGSVNERKKILESFLPILKNTKDTFERDNYIYRLAKATGFESDAIRKLVDSYELSPTYITAHQVMNKFQPEKKGLRRLELAEREFLYQMLQNSSAVTFYEKNIDGFYDEVYRKIATFLVDYIKEYGDFELYEIIGALESSDIEDKDALIGKISEIYFEKYHPKKCDENLLNEYLKVINSEKEKIFENDMLTQSLKGKDDREKARILADHNRMRMRKEKYKKEGN